MNTIQPARIIEAACENLYTGFGYQYTIIRCVDVPNFRSGKYYVYLLIRLLYKNRNAVTIKQGTTVVFFDPTRITQDDEYLIYIGTEKNKTTRTTGPDWYEVQMYDPTFDDTQLNQRVRWVFYEPTK